MASAVCFVWPALWLHHGTPNIGSFMGLRLLQGFLGPTTLHGPLMWVTCSLVDLCLITSPPPPTMKLPHCLLLPGRPSSSSPGYHPLTPEFCPVVLTRPLYSSSRFLLCEYPVPA